MKKINNYRSILIACGLVFLVFFSAVFYHKNKSNDIGKNKEVRLGDCVFDVELAEDQEARKKGLSDRASICKECGMLFIFQEKGNFGFWMKDMLFDLDILWIRDGKVVEIIRNISYNSRDVYQPKELIDMVLEINAQEAQGCKIEVGQELR